MLGGSTVAAGDSEGDPGTINYGCGPRRRGRPSGRGGRGGCWAGPQAWGPWACHPAAQLAHPPATRPHTPLPLAPQPRGHRRRQHAGLPVVRGARHHAAARDCAQAGPGHQPPGQPGDQGPRRARAALQRAAAHPAAAGGHPAGGGRLHRVLDPHHRPGRHALVVADALRVVRARPGPGGWLGAPARRGAARGCVRPAGRTAPRAASPAGRPAPRAASPVLPAQPSYTLPVHRRALPPSRPPRRNDLLVENMRCWTQWVPSADEARAARRRGCGAEAGALAGASRRPRRERALPAASGGLLRRPGGGRARAPASPARPPPTLPHAPTAAAKQVCIELYKAELISITILPATGFFVGAWP